MSVNQSNERLLALHHAPATFTAYMELSRYQQTLAVSLSTMIGAVFAGATLAPAALIAVTVSNICLFVGATAFNDACDVTEDSFNKPHRPVPSGRVSRARANVFAAVCFTIGLILAALVSPWLGMAAATICVMSVGYAMVFKRIPFLGNVVVATISTYPLYCMLIIGGELNQAFLHVIAAFLLFRFGAELIKTAEDRAGDSYAGIRTAATVFGEATIYRFGSVLLILAVIILSVAPEHHWIVAIGLAISMALAIAALVLSFRTMGAEQGRQMIYIERAIIAVMITVLTLRILIEKFG